MSSGSSARLARLEAKLEKYVSENKLYEAEQMYTTLCSRYLSQHNYETAAHLASNGALRLLQERHASNAGAKLSLVLIDVFEAAKFELTDDRRNTLLSIFDAFSESGSLARIKFMKQAIRWSAANGSCRAGDAALHCRLAEYFQKLESFGDAESHYLHARNYEKHAEFLLQWADRGYPSERDLFITRCVLQYLCLQNLEGANKVFSNFMQARPELASPLINFCRFLLRTMERDAAPLFQMLRTKYDLSLQRDESFDKYMDSIGQVFFDLKPRSGSGGGLFSELLQMFDTSAQDEAKEPTA